MRAAAQGETMAGEDARRAAEPARLPRRRKSTPRSCAPPAPPEIPAGPGRPCGAGSPPPAAEDRRARGSDLHVAQANPVLVGDAEPQVASDADVARLAPCFLERGEAVVLAPLLDDRPAEDVHRD